MNTKLSSLRLKEILLYVPETGMLFWKENRGGWAKKHTIAGWYHPGGYVRISVDGVNYQAQRLAWLYMTGNFPKMLVDHKDRDKHNNKWKNLQESNHSDNAKNVDVREDNKSKITGVYLSTLEGKWKVQIGVNNERVNLGTFETKCEAAYARWEGEKLYNWPNIFSPAYLYLKKWGYI